VTELLSVGCFYAGPLPARPQDVLGFAAGRTRVNPRVAEGQSLETSPTVHIQDAEYPFELFYNINLRPWLSIAPLVQYISHAGGTSAYPDIWVLGGLVMTTGRVTCEGIPGEEYTRCVAAR
jgi:porin